jgi:hypothetical protein
VIRVVSISLLSLTASCIAPSVLDEHDRSVTLDSFERDWRPAEASDVPGTYVSTELSGQLAFSVKKLVYLFQPAGTYAGAALVDGAPPHFELVQGTWEVEEGKLSLDGGTAAGIQVAGDGALLLAGAEGRVLLRREQER